MKKYEYNIVYDGFDGWYDRLTKLANDGWRVIDVSPVRATTQNHTLGNLVINQFTKYTNRYTLEREVEQSNLDIEKEKEFAL